MKNHLKFVIIKINIINIFMLTQRRYRENSGVVKWGRTGWTGNTSFVVYRVVRYHMYHNSSSQMVKEERVRPVKNKFSR